MVHDQFVGLAVVVKQKMCRDSCGRGGIGKSHLIVMHLARTGNSVTSISDGICCRHGIIKVNGYVHLG